MSKQLRIGFLLMMLFLSDRIIIYAQKEVKLSNEQISKVAPEQKQNARTNHGEPKTIEYDFDALTIDYSVIASNQNAKYCLPLIQGLFEKLSTIPDLNQDLALGILNSKNNFVEMFHYGFRMLGATAGGFGPPVGGTQNSTRFQFEQKNEYEKLAYLSDKIKLELNKSTEEEWSEMSPDLRSAILSLIYAINESAEILVQFNKPIIDDLMIKYNDFGKRYEEILIQPWVTRQLNDFNVIDVIDKVDLKKLSFANRILNEGIRDFINIKSRLSVSGFKHCEINSKWGKIGVYGTNNDTINDVYCLLIDFGGNETYSGNLASSISLEKPIGILIDFEGDDNYISKGSIAKGILGMGALFDLKGNDKYVTESSGIGSSLFGSSTIYDASGNDEYISNSSYSQGAAHIGTSILCDLSGNDIYKSKSYSQAYGGTLGCGMLIDFEGDDIYGDAENFENCQNSFVQGAASGRWAEATDGQSLAGGIGMLMDYDGNDQYFAKSFSQAASYYLGLGYLFDKSGNDKYNAFTHSQGYSAHYALSAFIEIQGDDLYNGLTNVNQLSQIIGSGRDFASGWLIDFWGDDEFHYGNRSAGIGDMNGVGVLWDCDGNDAYFHHKNEINTSSPSLGKSIEMNNQILINYRLLKTDNPLNIGLHIDTSGLDVFKKQIK